MENTICILKRLATIPVPLIFILTIKNNLTTLTITCPVDIAFIDNFVTQYYPRHLLLKVPGNVSWYTFPFNLKL